jgi:hypothetical protein
MQTQEQAIQYLANLLISGVTRLEVIDHQTPETGRVYTKKDCQKVELSIQDDGKTLKIFISKK